MMVAVAPAPGGLAASRFARQSLRDGTHVGCANRLPLRARNAKNAECRDAENHAQVH